MVKYWPSVCDLLRKRVLALGWSDGLASWASSLRFKHKNKPNHLTALENRFTQVTLAPKLSNMPFFWLLLLQKNSSTHYFSKQLFCICCDAVMGNMQETGPPSGSSLSLMCCRYVPVSSLTSSVVVMGHSSSSNSRRWILGLSPGEMQQDTEPPIVDLQLSCRGRHRFPYNRGGNHRLLGSTCGSS